MSYMSRAEKTHDRTRKQTFRFYLGVQLAVAALILFAAGCAATSPSTDPARDSIDHAGAPAPEALEGRSVAAGSAGADGTAEEGGQLPPLPAVSGPASYPTFQTFNNTGNEICTNDEGLPVIYLFSSSLCSHCKWGGGAYDFIVRFLAADGLIEAHHYDLLSGDDLLTEEAETEIPEDKLELYRNGNPKDLVPYYNFACAYDRIGNGYEKKNDLVAEGEEMRRVIEALVEMASKVE